MQNNGASTDLINGASTDLINGASTDLINGASTDLINGASTDLINGASTDLINGVHKKTNRKSKVYSVRFNDVISASIEQQAEELGMKPITLLQDVLIQRFNQ